MTVTELRDVQKGMYAVTKPVPCTVTPVRKIAISTVLITTAPNVLLLRSRLILEHSIEIEGALRTNVYYCNPMQSGQKGKLEKNHEYIRYVIPKGKSLIPYTQEDITLLVNHINSTKRPGLNNLSPYEMISEDDEDMHKLMKFLDLKPIPANEVNLTKNLLEK